MRTYDETNASTSLADGWEDFPDVTNTETMEVGKGYRLFIRDNISAIVANNKIRITGGITTGDFNFNPSFTSSGSPGSDGWNFVSNPYPSSIDWANANWTKTGLEAIAYVWDAKNKNYRTINSANGIIPPLQGFWIQASSASPELIVREACKVSSSQPFSRSSEVTNQLEIAISDRNSESLYNTSITYLTLDQSALVLKDSKDINQLGRNTGFEEWSSEILLDIATKSEDDYVLRNNFIPSSAEVEEIPLSITFNEGSEFNFEFHKKNFRENAFLVLKDNYLGTEKNIEEHFFVNFEVDDNLASKASDRFSILVSSEPLLLNDKIDVSSLKIFPNPSTNGKLNVSGLMNSPKGLISLSDMNGVLMSEREIISNNGSINETIDVSNLEKGVYLFTIKTSAEIFTQKVIVE